jgi:hypothetical protein
MEEFIGNFRDAQNSDNSGWYIEVSYDLINCNFIMKVYEPLLMYELNMNLVV